MIGVRSGTPLPRESLLKSTRQAAGMRPDSLLTQLEKTLTEAPAESVPALLGDLECLRARLWVKLVTPSTHPVPPSETEKLLPPKEAAELLQVKISWLYRNWKRLPFARKLGRKTLRFSEPGLRRWQATRRA